MKLHYIKHSRIKNDRRKYGKTICIKSYYNDLLKTASGYLLEIDLFIFKSGASK